MLTVGGEHREAVERVVERHALEAGPIQVDEVQIEIASLRIVNVRREDQTLVAGQP